MVKDILVNHFPQLGRYKRWAKAWMDHVAPVKPSYSQHREDIFIWEYLKGYPLKGSVYVDVGGNHPSDISNSYLLYRHGLEGIVVEPNQELIGLFRKFRKKDIALGIGCSNTNAILPFHISKTPVLSSFSEDREDLNVYRTRYLPVIRLDDALQKFTVKFVSLLSIDVEGLNYEVLEGAQKTAERSLLVCLEYDNDDDRRRLLSLLGDQFELIKEFGCNMLLVNRRLEDSLRQNQ
jgi:FkbM family methyltransferase